MDFLIYTKDTKKPALGQEETALKLKNGFFKIDKYILIFIGKDHRTSISV